ncbi:MAG: sigma-54-dependent Fis family transcriptional regulator [Bdellovibrionales bacterium]|nr:sigma-54-dependent Fis family transcriptional regulator [Oligoflexia bacterium]
MKTLYLQLRDPSGHQRSLKCSQFPLVLGTQLQEKNQLRDPKLPPQAFSIESRQNGFTLRSLVENLNFQIGDLKLNALELPMLVPLCIGDTQLLFSASEHKDATLEFPKGEQAWYTESEKGLRMLSSIRKSSMTKLSIYLSGETGTGKEVLAKLVHLWSERSTGSFVPINCGALSMSLVESELFGHVKGSFTGAIRDRPGALLQAHGGTLFLDEVGDLPAELQMKLLRFLESGEIRPVGSDRVLHADVRLICATHKPLLKLVQEGKFRQDLYFRLASIPIEIPSLRSRPDDVRALALVFAKEQGKTLTQEAILRLQAHIWPGNVRELRHAVERASGLSGPFEKVMHAQDFEFLISQNIYGVSEEASQSAGQVAMPGVSSLKEMEKILILRALKLANGNRKDAAKILGIARSTLFEMMKRHQIIGPKSTDYWLAALTNANS